MCIHCVELFVNLIVTNTIITFYYFRRWNITVVMHSHQLLLLQLSAAVPKECVFHILITAQINYWQIQAVCSDTVVRMATCVMVLQASKVE